MFVGSVSCILATTQLFSFSNKKTQVVVLGDTHTGKTSLVLRFVEGYYRASKRTPTVGAFFLTKRVQIEGITCKIQIWDTAGQPQFRPMACMYYQNAAAAVLCYDVASRSSFAVVQHWLEELHRNVSAGSIVICLCATKTDQPHPHAVSAHEAQQLAHTTGAMFHETSAQHNQHVHQLFQRVAERVLQFRQQDIGGRSSRIPVTPGAAIHKPLSHNGPQQQQHTGLYPPSPSNQPSNLLDTEDPHTDLTDGTVTRGALFDYTTTTDQARDDIVTQEAAAAAVEEQEEEKKQDEASAPMDGFLTNPADQDGVVDNGGFGDNYATTTTTTSRRDKRDRVGIGIQPSDTATPHDKDATSSSSSLPSLYAFMCGTEETASTTCVLS